MTRNGFLRLLVDGFMIISILFAIANKLTENRIHELIGIAMFLLLLVHNFFNWKWYTTIFQWKYNIRRNINFTVNTLLVMATITLIVSGVITSKTLFSFLGIETNLTLRQIHTTAAYWLFVLTSVHLGVHWASFTVSLEKMIPALSRIRLPVVFKLSLSIIAVIYGGIAAYDRDICSKLFMIYAFDFWDFSQSATKFFLNYLTIIAAFVIVTQQCPVRKLH